MFSSINKLSRSIVLQNRKFSSIPINHVASIWKMNVANETNAMTMDGIISGEILPTIKNATGYVGAQRMVCKSEWAYELIFEFDSLDNFKAWKSSSEYEALMKKTPDNLSKIGVTMEEAYNGARVIDHL